MYDLELCRILSIVNSVFTGDFPLKSFKEVLETLSLLVPHVKRVESGVFTEVNWELTSLVVKLKSQIFIGLEVKCEFNLVAFLGGFGLDVDWGLEPTCHTQAVYPVFPIHWPVYGTSRVGLCMWCRAYKFWRSLRGSRRSCYRRCCWRSCCHWSWRRNGYCTLRFLTQSRTAQC